MTHLNEGQLHAYLDGERGTPAREMEAHLARCGECRAKLEQERGVRDRARAILGAAGPASLTPPPFDLVVQRAAEKREARRSTRPGLTLAWAASLALAITVGWYARGLVVGSAETGLVATAGAPGGEQVRAEGIQAAPPATRQVAQGVPALVDTPQRRQEALDTAAAQTTMADAAPPAVAPAAPVANLAAAEAKAERVTEAAPPRAAEAPAPSSAAPADAVQRSVIQTRAATRDIAEEAWVTVPPTEAERRLGGSLATIPGLPSLGTSVSGTGPSTVARTIQVLGPGLTIELIQRRAATETGAGALRERAAAPSAMPAPGRAMAGGEEPGRSLTVQWEVFSVTGRALVPADSLQKLLGRLRRP